MKKTQLQNGIILAQPQPGPSINLPINSVDYANLTTALQMMLPPVGSSMSAYLTEAQFQAQMGPGWILQDGRTVAGSTYTSLTGMTAVPDARGMILRGSNDGGSAAGARADGNQNPDGTLTMGEYQADQYASHAHSVYDPGHTHSTNNIFANNSGGGGGGNIYTDNGGFGGHGVGINGAGTGIGIYANGGNETRAKNITINHFIRIN